MIIIRVVRMYRERIVNSKCTLIPIPIKINNEPRQKDFCFICVPPNSNYRVRNIVIDFRLYDHIQMHTLPI